MPFDATFDRCTTIGASEAAVILDPHHRYQSPYELWEIKTRRKPAPDVDTPLTRYGNHMEDFIAGEFTKEYGIAVVPGGKTVRHPKYPNISVTPDFLFADGAEIIEIKAPTKGKFAWGDTFAEAPYGYQLQARINASALDRPCSLVPWIEGEISWHRTQRSPKTEAEICDALQEWYDKYVTKDTPPPTDHARDLERLQAMFPKSNGLWLQNPPMDLRILCVQYEADKAKKGEFEDRMKAVRVRIENILKGYDGAEFSDGGKVTFKSNKDSVKTAWEDVARSVAPSEAALAKAIEAHTTLSFGARPLKVIGV